MRRDEEKEFIELFDSKEYKFSDYELGRILRGEVCRTKPKNSQSPFDKDYIIEAENRFFRISLIFYDHLNDPYESACFVYHQPVEVLKREISVVIPEHIEKEIIWEDMEGEV